MEHLGVEPIELVPVEAGSGPVHAIEIEHRCRFGQAEALLHALRRRPAEQGHVVGQGLGHVAHAAEIAHGGHAIALGKLAALLVEDQGGVGEQWGGGAEGLVEQQLLGRVGDVVLAADHVADGHGGVIDHDHKVVEGISDPVGRGAPGNHHVAPQIGTGPAHLPPNEVVPNDGGVVVDAEAHRGFAALGNEGLLLLGAEVAVAVVVARRQVTGCLLLAHRRELRFGGVAAVGAAGGEQLCDGQTVLGDAGALDHRLPIPLEAQPLKAFENVGRVFVLAAFAVGVLDAEEKLAAVAPGE